VQYFYAERYVPPEGVVDFRLRTEVRITSQLYQLEAQFKRSGGLWLLGDTYTVADCMVFVLCCWTRNLQCPANSLPTLGAYIARMRQRPAVQRACATEQLPESFFKRPD
jgi:glutathione S-transferase